MDKELITHIEYFLCINIESVRPISGGDSSKAYLLTTATEALCCKINRGKNAFQLFQTEKEGLKAIAQSKTIATPKVLLCEKYEEGAFLILEYIEPKHPSSENMALLGHQLAALHQLTSSETFGWKTHNFIGSLPQSNNNHPTWTEFFVQERLLPQLRMARDTQLLTLSEIPTETQISITCKNSFPEVRPCLLHGDLWSGNYLISQKGVPYLIDPSVYYGHHEVDIAMTNLFGGFGSYFYDAYADHFPEMRGEKERQAIYQLYYLLVHLNLFGGSYKDSVKALLKTYF